MNSSVAVIIPASGPRLLRRAIRSARLQEVDPEVVVSLCGLIDPRAREIAREEGARIVEGPGRTVYEARRAGCRTSSAPFVAFLDADDRLDRGCLGAALTALEEAPDAHLARMEMVRTGRWLRLPYRSDVAMIGRLFRRGILEPLPDIGYDGFWGEDRLFTLHLSLRSPREVEARRARYLYTMGGKGSVSLTPRREEEYREVQRLIAAFGRLHGRPELEAASEAELQRLLRWHHAPLTPLKARLLRLL